MSHPPTFGRTTVNTPAGETSRGAPTAPRRDPARPGRTSSPAPADADPLDRRAWLGLALSASALLLAGAPRAEAAPRTDTAALSVPLGGVDFLHRWSKDSQHEFTPAGDEDLNLWRDMLTLNVHAGVRHGQALADLANGVLARYQEHGKVLVTRSVPRTAAREAEHLIVAVLGRPQFLEAAFARVLMHEGTGVVGVLSHRVYGSGVGPEMSRWLAAEGQRTEAALMGWNRLPPLARLDGLPRG